MSPEMVERLRAQARRDVGEFPPPLSDRQRTIVRLVVSGRVEAAPADDVGVAA